MLHALTAASTVISYILNASLKDATGVLMADSKRYILKHSFFVFYVLALFSFIINTPPAAAICALGVPIHILNKGTDNPTLACGNDPFYKAGPLPERAPFRFEWGSTYFVHRQWLDFQQQYELGYGRVFPELAYSYDPLDADRRIFPFELVSITDGRPIVDLTRFNSRFWNNMAHFISEAAQRGVILQIQLYARDDFAPRDFGWRQNYFNPDNNINDYPVPPVRGGYGLFEVMTQDTVWKDIHRQWVRHILNAIGNTGNVMIDLMNEGSFSEGITRDWVEFTLNIIETWERRTGNDILVGMDFDHLLKIDGGGAELRYILAHPRMELIIAEGEEGHIVPELRKGDNPPLISSLAIEYRNHYHKPVISTNSPSFGISLGENDVLLLYEWFALMAKVQGVDVFAHDWRSNPLPTDSAREYGQRSQILIDFFNTLADYAKLDLASDIIGPETPAKHRLALSSPKEIVVYLHTGLPEQFVSAGQPLILNPVKLPDGNVTISILNPETGKTSQMQGAVQNSQLSITLPAFNGDIALHIVNR
ncbi:MAG: DUF6298 domain-containing protein [Pseudomonadota bacterium]|nr:DUF6298 domain-containing protein [Pseudomonadota bacterium]